MTAVAKPPILYAKVGVTPGTDRMLVFDRDLGDFITHVVEVDVTGGWLVRRRTDHLGRLMTDGNGQQQFEKLRGHYCIFQRPPAVR